MRANEPIDDALAKAAGEHVKKLVKRLDKVAKKGDADSVHDARTAIRRVREDLVVMGASAFDPKRTAKIEDELHDLEKALAKARDSDVLLAKLKEYETAHDGAAADLADLEKRLAKRRDAGAKQARRQLSRSTPTMRRLRRLVRGKKAIVAQRPSDPTKATPHLVHHFTREALWRHYDAILAYETRRPPDADVLHRFRAACRRLRYALELFADALPDASSLVHDLRELQVRIGDMHDAHVAATLLTKWVASGKIQSSAAVGSFIEDRERARDGARTELLKVFEEVLGPPFRENLARVLEREAA